MNAITRKVAKNNFCLCRGWPCVRIVLMMCRAVVWKWKGMEWNDMTQHDVNDNMIIWRKRKLPSKKEFGMFLGTINDS